MLSPHSSILVGANVRKIGMNVQVDEISTKRNTLVDEKDETSSTKEDQVSILEVIKEET